MSVESDLVAAYDDGGEIVTPAVGSPFSAFMNYAGESVFERGSVARATLRYPLVSAPSLVEGSQIAIDGAQWRLAEDPSPIGDGLEVTVPLQRV